MLVAKLKHAALAVTSPRAMYLCARARRSNMTRQPDAHRMGRVSNVRQTCGAVKWSSTNWVPSDSCPFADLGRALDPAARFNHGAPDLGSKCRGRNRLFRDDAHLDKLRPNAPHRAL